MWIVWAHPMRECGFACSKQGANNRCVRLLNRGNCNDPIDNYKTRKQCQARCNLLNLGEMEDLNVVG